MRKTTIVLIALWAGTMPWAQAGYDLTDAAQSIRTQFIEALAPMPEQLLLGKIWVCKSYGRSVDQEAWGVPVPRAQMIWFRDNAGEIESGEKWAGPLVLSGDKTTRALASLVTLDDVGRQIYLRVTTAGDLLGERLDRYWEHGRIPSIVNSKLPVSDYLVCPKVKALEWPKLRQSSSE